MSEKDTSPSLGIVIESEWTALQMCPRIRCPPVSCHRRCRLQSDSSQILARLLLESYRSVIQKVSRSRCRREKVQQFCYMIPR
jgi:hypothetical protein